MDAWSLGRTTGTGAGLPSSEINSDRATAPGSTGHIPQQRPPSALTRRLAPFARSAASNERALGAALREVRDGEIYELLGFVRLGDYVVESLGLSYRTAQELIRVEEALDALPRLAEAFEEGEISAAHVRILTRVATERDESWWLARARVLNVRQLARMVAAAVEREAAGDRGAGTMREAGGAEGEAGAAAAEGDVVGAGSAAAEILQAAGVETGADSFVLSVSLPVWIRGLWRDTVTFVRQLAGSPLSAGAALKEILAESSASGDGLGGSASTSGNDSDLESGDFAVEASDLPDPATGRTSSRTTEPVSEPNAAHCTGLRVVAEGDSGSLDDPMLDSEAESSTEAGTPSPGERARAARPVYDIAAHVAARDLDIRLHELVRERQRLEAERASRLVAARAAGSWHVHGCFSLAEYAREHLGVSERQMYYLMALNRTLERLPDLARAHVQGELTLRQTLLIGRVATKATTSAWVRRAGRTTLRRLEDEVEYYEHLREVRPEVWRLLEEGPLPEGVELVPGYRPRLHACAPVGEGAEVNPGDGWSSLHVSTRSADGAGSVADDDRRSLQGSARVPAVDARAFLEALEADEAAVPMPTRRSTLRIRVDRETGDAWDERMRHYRSLATEPIEDWEIFTLILKDFWRTWDNSMTRRQRRDNPTLERDGWRCTAPGCRSVGSGALHEHHIIYRSAGGALVDPENLTTLCTRHHEGFVHEGLMRCKGTAPDRILWELGTVAGLAPFLTFRGEIRAGGAADWGSRERTMAAGGEESHRQALGARPSGRVRSAGGSGPPSTVSGVDCPHA